MCVCVCVFMLFMCVQDKVWFQYQGAPGMLRVDEKDVERVLKSRNLTYQSKVQVCVSVCVRVCARGAHMSLLLCVHVCICMLSCVRLYVFIAAFV